MKKNWTKFEESGNVEGAQNLTDLRVMTYNVWFEDHFKEQRYHVIMKMIRES